MAAVWEKRGKESMTGQKVRMKREKDKMCIREGRLKSRECDAHLRGRILA